MTATPSSAARTFVVTGGTRGIGLGLVTELARRGHQVALCGRSQAAVDEAVAGLSGLPGRVIGVVADVTAYEDVQLLWDKATAELGRIDHWVNNAGVSAPRRPLWETDPAALRAVVDVNLAGVVNGCHVALRGMVAQGSGHVWNMEGFGSGGQKADGMAVYGATKRGLSHLTACLQKDLKGSPVGVSYLSPGIVMTDLLVDDYAGQPDKLAKTMKVFNILGDRVETVTPFLVDGMLRTTASGSRVAWLTRRKAVARFATAGFRKRDITQAAS